MPHFAQRTQSLARCPHKREDGALCDTNLSPGLFAPDGWCVYTIPLTPDQRESAHGYRKNCPRCGKPVELIIRNAA